MVLFTVEQDIDWTSKFMWLDIFVVFEWRKAGLCYLYAFCLSMYHHPITFQCFNQSL
jgi:hypothetical protein